MGSVWRDEGTVEAWVAGAERRADSLRAATDLMFELARLPVGGEVLEVGSGTGEVALIAAAMVGDTGRVDAVDSSPVMAAAAERATEHLPHVVVTVADAADLPFDGPFDGAVSRNTLMLVDEPAAMLRELYRVLRPGARVALTVWSSAGRNPRMRLPLEALEAIGAPPPGPDRSLARVFRAGDPETLAGLLAGAGFTEAQVHRVPADTVYENPETAMAALRANPSVHELFRDLSDADRAGAWAYIESQAAGQVRFPGEQLVAAAVRPLEHGRVESTAPTPAVE